MCSPVVPGATPSLGLKPGGHGQIIGERFLTTGYVFLFLFLLFLN